MARRVRSALEHLAAEPHRFQFDAGVRLLEAASPPGETEPIRYAAPANLAHPAAELLAAAPPGPDKPAHLLSTVTGLVGPSGMMPRWYTELVSQAVRARSRAVADFFDLLAQRLVAGFARAGAKYRLARSAEATRRRADGAEPIGDAVAALTGYGTPGLAERLAAGMEPLQHYAGFFQSRPRSASRLAAMVSDYLGRPAEIVEFAGSWLDVPPDQQSRMPRGLAAGSFNRLGVDAAIGARAWDQQARFILRIGSMSRAEFEALLPDRAALVDLVSLVRAYVGWEVDFAINLLLDAAAVPPMRLAGRTDAATAPRLGWTTWTPSSSAAITRVAYRDEALFAASVVEAMASHARAI